MLLTLLNISTISNATDYISKVNWNNPTWDIFLILFFITFAFFYGIFLGRDKIIHILISTFFAYAIAINSSFLNLLSKDLNASQISFLKLAIFIILTSLTFFLLVKKSILSNLKMYANKWWHVGLYSFVHTGLFISMILHILDKHALTVFGPFVHTVFISDISFLLWMLSSILALVILKGGESQ